VDEVKDEKYEFFDFLYFLQPKNDSKTKRGLAASHEIS